MNMTRAIAACFVALLTVTACESSTAADTPPRYAGGGTVLQDAHHGPQLCQAVALSYPPQCSGIDLVGWDWNAVEHESSESVTWGSYQVVGTWDGKRLTLTEPPRPPAKESAPPEENMFASPCPAPAGGWRPVDPAKATQAAMDRAIRRAEKLEGFAGAWLDQAYLAGVPSPQASTAANNPVRLVLNLKFTGDLAAPEREIRQVWGGALCLSPAERSQARLDTIQKEVEREVDGLQSAGVDIVGGRVDVSVFVATAELQRRLDDRYGKGAVMLHGILRPK